MKIQIRDRDRRALIGLTLALAVYLTMSELVFPAYDRLALASEAAVDKEDQLRRYRRALSRQTRDTELISEARDRVAELDGRWIQAESEGLASVQLQALVEEASQGAGIGVEQRNIVGMRQLDDYFGETTMTLSFDATPDQLVQFLTDLRVAPKVLTVGSIEIRPLEVVHEVPDQGELEKTLRVSLSVGALVLNPL